MIYVRYLADLHVHSHFSRATSDHCRPRPLAAAAARKGLTVIGTGDFTHAGWRAELDAELVPAEDGLYRLREAGRDASEAQAPGDAGRYGDGDGHGYGHGYGDGDGDAHGHGDGQRVRQSDGTRRANDARATAREGMRAGAPADVRFLVTGEISCIYKQDGRTRKIHHVVLVPSLDAAARISAALEARGANLEADGRPIIGLDSRTLLALVLDTEPEAALIPAHIWTPHFSLFGANSGFDTLEECFGDLAGEITAYETGLSSDPPMNWRLSALDRLTLVSNSDAHSPDRLGREAIEFEAPLSYQGIVEALRGKGGRVAGTIEFYPEEGKYHYDGHRACGVCWHPNETLAAGGVCPVCGRPVTIGVLHRVAELADRPEGFRPAGANPYTSLVSLDEIVAEALGAGKASKHVRETTDKLLDALGPEIPLLRETPLEDVAAVAGPVVAEAVRRVRHGEVSYRPGYDGEYGKLTIFRPEERRELSGQAALFGFALSGAGRSDAMAPRATDRHHRHRGADLGMEGALDGMTEDAAAQEPELELAAPRAVARQLNLAIVGSSLPETAPSWLEGLNASQQQAVTARKGPVIVTAGPGTGKTRTLVQRIAFLLHEGVAPETITAITFTHRAADEMRTRLESTVGRGAERVHVGTFHRFCAEVIGEALGAPPLVLDEREAGVLAAEAAASVAAARGTKRIAAPAEAFSRLKSRGLLPGDPGVPSALAEPYRRYQELLAAAGAYDYDDLLLAALEMVQNDKRVSRVARERATHLLVDEFQDVNPVQYQLVRTLAGDGRNLFVIGDPDQAIYAFRGADRRFFAQLSADFPSATHIRLTVNYRSSDTVVRAANALMPAANATAARPGGQLVRYVAVDAPREEPRAVVREIERLVGGTGMLAADRHGQEHPTRQFSLGEIAVLFRTSRQADPIEQALLAEGIPYRSLGQRAVLATPAVREALDILRCVDRPTDLRFLIALRDTRFNPGAEALGMLKARAATGAATGPAAAWAGNQNVPLAEVAAALVREDCLPPDARVRIKALLDLLAELGALAPTATAADLLLRAAPPEAAASSRALRQLVRAAQDRSLSEFLFRLATGQDADHESREDLARPGEGVTLLTMHAAKGLEFPAVILVGLADGIVPWKDSLDGEALEEERRLFYVAVTRAAEELVLIGPPTEGASENAARSQSQSQGHSGPQLRSQSGSRCQSYSRSRFIGELPSDILKLIDTAADTDKAARRKTLAQQHRLF